MEPLFFFLICPYNNITKKNNHIDLNTADKEAWKLMEKHGLLIKGWRFKFDNSKRRFGVCNYTYKTIGLSKNLTLLNDIDRVINTILHEIAHALVGNSHGHDEVWRAKAREIGCDGNRCYSHENTVRVEGNYVAVCPNGHTRYRFKKPKTQQSCGACSKSFNPNALLVWNRVQK